VRRGRRSACLLLLGFEPVVLLLELDRAGDLLEHLRELHGRLGGELGDVPLEDEEAGVRLDKDAERPELGRVRLPLDDAAVDAVLADAILVDAARELDLEPIALVDQRHVRGALLCGHAAPEVVCVSGERSAAEGAGVRTGRGGCSRWGLGGDAGCSRGQCTSADVLGRTVDEVL